ncbi:hypothetical protein [Novosphingobium colocasiae]|uniref:GDT1 family protein n=1 Tax=Novosphingobium colocasiae TaxID=1256513 RepID=A0A918P8I0_9SPHN|nr:hypothetical protein [Novosphingobium colocasiae]GGY91538.1 hypothetical protein GCM10011614_02790 [Novosphingobium colocasiae]
MPALYFTFIAVLLAGLGSRDQMTMAALSARRGRDPGLLLVAVLAAVLTAGFAAYAAQVILTELPAPARAIFAGIALGMAGLESLVLVPRRDLEEPTHSLFATFLVLLIHQVTDAARFMIFGVAVGTNAVVPAGIGGVIGGVVLAAVAWGWPHLFARPALRVARRLVGAVLLMVAIGLALSEFGIL